MAPKNIQGLTGKSRQFFLVGKILISKETLKMKLSNFVSLLRIQMGQISYTIWPPLPNKWFSKMSAKHGNPMSDLRHLL